jgi:hypothetical protein
MPVQTRSAARRNAQPEIEHISTPTLQTPEEIFIAFDREASTIVSETPVDVPLADDEEWSIVYVKFQTQLLNRPIVLGKRRLCTFSWWLRFRNKKNWWACAETAHQSRERVKDIVRAQVAPSHDYQKQCDYCHVKDPKNGHDYLPYYVHDEDFIDIAFMPHDMDTSDDDEHARILVPKLISLVEKLKACRDAH